MEGDQGSIWYKWGLHEFLGDGTLRMRTSGYEGDWHFCGKHDVAPHSPDFAFWRWLINDRKPMRVFSSGEMHAWVEGNELEALREEYRTSSVETR